jgi:GTPase involved in cell partitioning and DNA repair
MFLDKVEIYIKAGDGGNGCVSLAEAATAATAVLAEQ